MAEVQKTPGKLENEFHSRDYSLFKQPINKLNRDECLKKQSYPHAMNAENDVHPESDLLATGELTNNGVALIYMRYCVDIFFFVVSGKLRSIIRKSHFPFTEISPSYP